MIVRNESPVIERCLASVKDWIDYWVIVDTGSTDGTQQIVRKALEDVPGELHERPWVDFEHNRNEALHLAREKGDYLLFIDADEQLVFSEEFQGFDLKLDAYLIKIHQENQAVYWRFALINTALNWAWVGVIHEDIRCKEMKTYAFLEGVFNLSVSCEGWRGRDPQKYHKDAESLERALAKDPTNCRYVSFLALSYEAAGECEKALKVYQKRAQLGGRDDEEVFYALYRSGVMQERLKMEPHLVIRSYCKAYLHRPKRAEPLFRLASYYLSQGDALMSCLVAEFAAQIPLPEDRIYVEKWVYAEGLTACLSDAKAALASSLKGAY